MIDTDFGIGIIRKGSAEDNLDFTPQEIDALTYDDLEKNRKTYLSLKEVSELERIYTSKGKE